MSEQILLSEFRREKQVADGRERFAVERCGAERTQGVQMQFRSITFMNFESVTGILTGGMDHPVIPVRFGKNACRRDGGGPGIAFYDILRRERETEYECHGSDAGPQKRAEVPAPQGRG